ARRHRHAAAGGAQGAHGAHDQPRDRLGADGLPGPGARPDRLSHGVPHRDARHRDHAPRVRSLGAVGRGASHAQHRRARRRPRGLDGELFVDDAAGARDPVRRSWRGGVRRHDHRREFALGGSRREPHQREAPDEHALVDIGCARAPGCAPQAHARRGARVRARRRGGRDHARLRAHAQGRAVEGGAPEDGAAAAQMSMPPAAGARVAPAPEIRMQGLVKSFKGPDGPIEAVRQVEIEIAAGETVALLGPNGAGKSTTIDMLLGLLEPDAGTVSVFGRSPADAVAAGAVGAMLQTGSLIRDLTVRELVSMMAALYPEPLAVEEVLQLTGTSEFAGQRTQKLSGGQTQRVRAAVALVSNPELLVLDEPTVALDVEGRNAFWRVMREFAASGRTILFATHYLEEADAYADRAVLMAHGKLVADGPTNEIKAMVGSRTIRATLPGADLDAL